LELLYDKELDCLELFQLLVVAKLLLLSVFLDIGSVVSDALTHSDHLAICDLFPVLDLPFQSPYLAVNAFIWLCMRSLAIKLRAV